jgi:hypothetical protein
MGKTNVAKQIFPYLFQETIFFCLVNNHSMTGRCLKLNSLCVKTKVVWGDTVY